MSENHPLSFKRIRRFLFLYFFRDFDKGTKDVGFEFTTLRPLRDGKVLCHAMTINPKGLRSDKFLVDASTRSILNLPGHYICYWEEGKRIDLRPKLPKSGRRNIRSRVEDRKERHRLR